MSLLTLVSLVNGVAATSTTVETIEALYLFCNISPHSRTHAHAVRTATDGTAPTEFIFFFLAVQL